MLKLMKQQLMKQVKSNVHNLNLVIQQCENEQNFISTIRNHTKLIQKPLA